MIGGLAFPGLAIAVADRCDGGRAALARAAVDPGRIAGGAGLWQCVAAIDDPFEAAVGLARPDRGEIADAVLRRAEPGAGIGRMAAVARNEAVGRPPMDRRRRV